MPKSDFLQKCNMVGVVGITETEHDEYEDGFKVIFKDRSAYYVIFHHEYGDAWTSYKTDKEYNEEWSRIKILTPQEVKEYETRAFEALKEKYSEPNWSSFMKNIFPDIIK